MVAQRLAELAQRANRREVVVFSRFLDPAECLLARQASRQAQVDLLLEGGHADAERKMAAFVPVGASVPEWPIACVAVSWDPRFGTLRHPDLLGASLALVQDRSCYGDILMREGTAHLFVLRELAEHVAGALEQAGRVRLSGSVLEQWPDATPQQVQTHRDTVASLRLDVLVASAFRISRTQAQALIQEGRVKLNHVPTLRTDAQVAQGDLLSLRGHGRALLAEVGGKSRKGRTAIEWSRCE